jgi:hypothetical protein
VHPPSLVRSRFGLLCYIVGEAEMEQQIERKIADLANSEAEMLTEQIGISPSLSSDEAKQYVRDVLKEIKARK